MMNDLNRDQNSSVSTYSPRLHHVGAVLWASFLSACIGTPVFFAMFDPVRLGEITTWPIELDRQWGYTLGFFGFWLLALLSSFITTILLLPGNKAKKVGNDQQ